MNKMVQPPPVAGSKASGSAAAANPYLSQLVVNLDSLDQAEAILKAQRAGWAALTAREMQLCRQAIETLAGSITARKEALFR